MCTYHISYKRGNTVSQDVLYFPGASMFDIMGVNPADKLCESGDWA